MAMRKESSCLQLLQKRDCAAKQSLLGKAGRWQQTSVSLGSSCIMLHPKGTNPTPQQGKRGHFLSDTALTGMILEGLQPPQYTSKAQLYWQITHGRYSLTRRTNLESCPGLLQVLLTGITEINWNSIRKSKNCQQLSRGEALQVSPYLELGTKAASWCCPTVKAACKPLWVLVHESRQRQKHPHSCSTIHSTPPSVPCEKAVLSTVGFQIHC